MLSTVLYFTYTDANRLKVKGQNKTLHTNTTQKKAGVAL